jgi:hypothetical protein
MFDRTRREFITLLTGAVSWPIAARAQPAAKPVIGYIGFGSLDNSVLYLAARAPRRTVRQPGRLLQYPARPACDAGGATCHSNHLRGA